MARIIIDNTKIEFPGTSIADLAQFTPGLDASSKDISVYDVEDALLAAWAFEIAPGSMEAEYPNWCQVSFKDGSRIRVGAFKAAEIG